jgi:beta-lactamase regulating signal transducer with metallopeptidase domain
MWDWTDRIGVILFDAALSTAVFSTFIVLAMLASRQPARRILLARVALLASLAILPLVVFGRLPRLDVIDTLVESRFFPRSLFLAATPVEEASRDAPVTPPILDHSYRVVSQSLTIPASTTTTWLPRGLALVDLTCVAVGSAWLLLGLAGVHWLIHRSRPPATSTRWLFDTLVAGRTTAVARTGLRVCSRLRHPVVTGLFHPTILIPEDLDRADGDAETLRLSLLHEIAHAERSDHWFSTAASMAQAIWFFIPQVWWIRSQLLIDQEFLADRSAAEHYGSSSSEYALALLSLVESGQVASAPTARNPVPDATAPGTIGVQSPLFQRMMMLLHCPYPVESRTPRVWSWASRLAVVVASIAATCVVVRWPQASLAVPPAPASSSPECRFQVTRFVAEPLPEAPASGRSVLYILPVALPAHFDLDVEVRSTEPDLSQIRIAGQPLGIPGGPTTPGHPLASGGSSSAGDPAAANDWHRVHIHSDHHRILVVVDGQAVPGPARTGSPSDWLTIEPPNHCPAEFRELMVSW